MIQWVRLKWPTAERCCWTRSTACPWSCSRACSPSSRSAVSPPSASTERRDVDTRIIAASNVDLQELQRAGRFREDLLARLRYSISLPPLRERPDDIPLLAQQLLERECLRQKRPVAGIDPEVIAFLRAQKYPRNIRDLQALIELSVALFAEAAPEGELPLQLEYITEAASYMGDEVVSIPQTSYHAAMAASERRLIEEALRAHKGRVSLAAAFSWSGARQLWSQDAQARHSSRTLQALNDDCLVVKYAKEQMRGPERPRLFSFTSFVYGHNAEEQARL